MLRSEEKIRKIGEIEFSIRYSGRKTLGISISPESGVVARVPYLTPDKEIDNMIRNKSDWINKVLIKHRSLVRLDPVRFIDGEELLFMGTVHFLKIISSDNYYVRKSNDNIIEVGLNGHYESGLVKTMLESWYKTVAKRILPQRFSEILVKYNKYNFSPAGFSVRSMKKRWGSCSSKGKIGISYDLIRLERIYADYVILHELCHLKHHNHGPGFYRLLSEIFPDWKVTREELRKIVR